MDAGQLWLLLLPFVVECHKVHSWTQVDLKPASDVLAGAMARAASQSTIHPLDTLKVGWQHVPAL